MSKRNIHIIGTMSGTSLDGLDICSVVFNGGEYEILSAKTVEYPIELYQKLQNAHTLSGLELSQLHVDYGIFCGKEIRSFLQESGCKPDYISSHGHTVFHTPETGLTLQIGSGPHIAKCAGVSTIYNIRSLDVAFGGQGAPLVPIGDEMLFGEYEYCLNIGGFANISTKTNNTRVAWDICAANIVLNHFARLQNIPYDAEGKLGKQGLVNPHLLEALQALPYFSLPAPKSLGREWLDTVLLPCIETYSLSVSDILRTLYEHIAIQITQAITHASAKVLCTGGGVYNSFLMERVAAQSKADFILPSQQIIDYKEALIFAYLGYLRVQEKPNCLSSVTGAQTSVCGGDISIIL